MKKNLMEYLFGVSQQESEIESILDEDFAALLEQADAEEGEQMAASKTPLVDALKSVGITAGELHEDPAGFCFYTSDREEYISAINALTDPDTMHKLAVKGWVATKCGDQAMSQEEPEYKIRFLEISTAEGSDKDKGEDQEAILKKAQEFASTEVDRDDEMNPVEQLPSKMGPKDKGVGKTTDGADPKGNIKDSLTAKDLVASMLEDCGQPGSKLKQPKSGGKVQHAFKAKKKK